MMNKESFLKELQARIAVLEDAEQQDILAEYAQHIDLRVAGGLTEEAAIQDFGNPDQLAAEILEAYHVKPSFHKPLSGVKTVSVPDPRPALHRACCGAGAFFRRCSGAVSRFFHWAGQGFSALFSKLGRGLKTLFRRRSRPETPERSEEIEEARKPMETVTNKKPNFSGASRAAGRGIIRFFRAAARLAWNLLLLICAMPFATAGLAALMCLGLLVVLLFQGYPLAGAAICCVGGVLCCAGVLGLGSGLIWRRCRKTVSAGSASPSETASGGPAGQELVQLISQTVQTAEYQEQEGFPHE